MTTAERWTVVAVVLVIASLVPAERTFGLIILALAAAALRWSRDSAITPSGRP